MVRQKNIKKIDENKSIRVRGEDLQNCIFPLNINKAKNSTKTYVNEPMPQSYTLSFTIFGQHDKLVDIYGQEQENGYPLTNKDERICSVIKYTGTNNPRYFVKVNDRGELFDPIGMYSEGGLNKDLKHAGKKEWRLKEVNNKIFSFYLNYLKTKNKAWLNNAIRENN
jgi:hypothetical protein